MCRAHAAVRQLLGSILEEEGVVAVVDMEAGLEHLSRGTDRHVDTLLVVLEPYHKSLETARRILELAGELRIPRTLGVANKMRDAEDEKAVAGYAERHELPLVGRIPFDDALRRADQAGRAPIEVGGDAVKRMEALATSLGL